MIAKNIPGEVSKRSPPEIAVLGIGAVEQHGPHLPLGTDWMIIEELSCRVAAELHAWLLPSIPFSMSECHGSFAGTVWIKPATLAAVLNDIANGLGEQGIKKLLILNGHGGNFVLEPAIREINKKLTRLHVILAPEDWPEADDHGKIFETAETDLHAGEIETSLQLYLNPQAVSEEKVDFVPQGGREFLDYATMDRISPSGVWGHASKGSTTKGERAMAAQVKAVTGFALQAFARGK
jgi:creatinine amidohydrolase